MYTFYFQISNLQSFLTQNAYIAATNVYLAITNIFQTYHKVWSYEYVCMQTWNDSEVTTSRCFLLNENKTFSGARTLYRHLPKSVGLRRITLHKSAALRGDKLYLLLCECANFLENVNSAAQLLPALRARLCGYTGIYRVAAAF